MRIPRFPLRGASLVETIVAGLVGCLLLLGVLAAWDLAARGSASEGAIAVAQASARRAILDISRAAAAAGTGGLYVTQAVLLSPDPDLPGVAVAPGGDYDNAEGVTVTDLSGDDVPVRAGTDVLHLRGVLFGPLIALDAASGCGACDGAAPMTARAVTSTGHVNHDPSNRPQFSRIDESTSSASAARSMLVLVAGGADRHAPCSGPEPDRAVPPQPAYTVGALSAPTALASTGTFGLVDFSNAAARELTTEDPGDRALLAAPPDLSPALRAGILDDVVFFVDDRDPAHPALARGLRRGARYDVVAIADDVEDLQVAYGVDGLYGADAVSADGAVGRFDPPTPEDPEPDWSTRPDRDEWAPNADGERTLVAGDLQSAQPPPAGFPHAGAAGNAHCPRLRAIAVTIVARTRDPETSYRGLDALGLETMNSPAGARSADAPRYRRRLATARIALRNFGPPR